MTEMFSRPIRQRVAPDEFGADVVVFTWRPGDRTRFHSHSAAGIMTVTHGTVYEVRDGVKHRASVGDVLRVNQGAWHIVGNDGQSIARTVHVYLTPELEMETRPDTSEDALALAT